MKNPYFDTRFKYTKERNNIWKILCRYLQQFIPDGSRVLDAGAGYCYFINNINADEKYALDNDSEVLKYASDNVNTIVGTTACTKFENGFFDIVFSSNLLEHLSIDEILLTLHEFNRIVKNGGNIIIISPNFKYSYKVYFDDYTHKSIITDNSLKDMLCATGFIVKKIRPKFLPFSADSRLPKSDLLLQLYLMSPWKPLAGQMLIIAGKAEEKEVDN